jgi:hypothetical protein
MCGPVQPRDQGAGGDVAELGLCTGQQDHGTLTGAVDSNAGVPECVEPAQLGADR